MPLYTNTERGTVSYQPDDGFNKQIILANDYTNTTKLANSTIGHSDNIYTIGSTQFNEVSDFSFGLGPSESVVGKYSLFFQQDHADPDLLYRFITVDPTATTTTAVASTIKVIGLGIGTASGIAGNADAVEIDATDANTMSLGTHRTDGIGTALFVNTTDTDNDKLVFGDFIIENATNTAATVKLQITARSGTESQLKLSRGSYLAYSKF
tara:strand:- start:614 stop:1243 length:630 start_codon:yes stop_codon:yes gene_type:complete